MQDGEAGDAITALLSIVCAIRKLPKYAPTTLLKDLLRVQSLFNLK